MWLGYSMYSERCVNVQLLLAQDYVSVTLNDLDLLS